MLYFHRDFADSPWSTVAVKPFPFVLTFVPSVQHSRSLWNTWNSFNNSVQHLPDLTFGFVEKREQWKTTPGIMISVPSKHSCRFLWAYPRHTTTSRSLWNFIKKLARGNSMSFHPACPTARTHLNEIENRARPRRKIWRNRRIAWLVKLRLLTYPRRHTQSYKLLGCLFSRLDNQDGSN